MAPWFSAYTHRTGFALDFSGFPINGTIYLDLPPFADANGNGFDDSFEVSQAAGGTSAGEYTTAASAVERSAPLGVVRPVRRPAPAGCVWWTTHTAIWGLIRHTFEVLEYTGSLTYTPGSNTVSGSVNVTNAADQLQGPLNFSKSIANPHNN